MLRTELLVARSDRLDDLRRGAHGPEGVVLVQAGDAEDRHHGVADVLLDRPAVLPHDG